MDVKKLFGQNLRTLRKQNGLSQEELAEKTNVSAKHIGALETGSSFVSSDLLERFSELLDQPVAAFFVDPTAQANLDRQALISSSIDKEMQSFATSLKNTMNAILQAK